MFTGILSLLGLISPLVSKILELKAARDAAASDIEKAKIDAAIQQLEFVQAIQVAEKSTINTVMRAIAASGPIAYFTKIFLWDKVIGAFYGCSQNNSLDCRSLFSTDPLVDPTLAWMATAVIGFYFVASVIKK